MRHLIWVVSRLTRSPSLWGHLLKGVFSTQRVPTLRPMNVSVPMLGEACMRRIESKKPVDANFLWSVTAASPMYDPPYQSRAHRGAWSG